MNYGDNANKQAVERDDCVECDHVAVCRQRESYEDAIKTSSGMYGLHYAENFAISIKCKNFTSQRPCAAR